jgi:GNAT superfamily N-acetyltransferase
MERIIARLATCPGLKPVHDEIFAESRRSGGPPAVDERVQGQGLGRYLFAEALGRTLDLARSGPVVFRLFVTDAIDAGAARFYERLGLAPLGDSYRCRMVLDLRPLVLVLEGS